jgi:6-phosphofructokinase 1
VVAEGAQPKGGAMTFKGDGENFKEHARLGGIAEQVAAKIEENTGKETRSMVLGHLQRGGSPVMMDRLLALRLGTAATRFLADTDLSGMVALRNDEIELIPLADATHSLRTVPLDSSLLQTGRDLGLCFGDEDPGRFLRGTLHPAPPP